MIPNFALLFTGLTIGLSVAVPVGPLGLLCIQRTLAGGMCIGVCTGLGAATVNVAYGALALFGYNRLGVFIAGDGRLLSFVGGLFLLWSAARTVLRRTGLNTPGQQPFDLLTPLSAYSSAVAFNAANPMGPMLIFALLSPVVRHRDPTIMDATNLLVGMFIAASCWWVCLSGSVSLLRVRLTPGMLALVDKAAAAVLTIYGAVALGKSIGF